MGTLHVGPAKGAQLLGLELRRCYQGGTLDGQRHGEGAYTYPNSFFAYTGAYMHGEKHGAPPMQREDMVTWSHGEKPGLQVTRTAAWPPMLSWGRPPMRRAG
jgi:hypothetical protein